MKKLLSLPIVIFITTILILLSIRVQGLETDFTKNMSFVVIENKNIEKSLTKHRGDMKSITKYVAHTKKAEEEGLYHYTFLYQKVLDVQNNRAEGIITIPRHKNIWGLMTVGTLYF